MFIYLKLGRRFILLVSKLYNCGYGECRGFQLWQSCVVFLDETLYSHQASLYPGVLINVYRRLLWYLTKSLRKGEGLLWTSLLFRESYPYPIPLLHVKTVMKHTHFGPHFWSAQSCNIYLIFLVSYISYLCYE